MNDFTAGWFVIILILTIGTVARLARLVTKDSITKPGRKWIERRMVKAGQRGLWNKLDDLVNCPWCVSIWAGIPSGIIMVWFGSNRFVIACALGLTASWIAGNVQIREPDDEPERIILVDDTDEKSGLKG